MKKYPVTSDSGNVYEVRVKDGVGIFGVTEVSVYGHRTGIFGNNRKRWLSSGEYLPDGWAYDYVAMARSQVRKYEESIAEEIRRKRQQAQGIEAFAEWDGN